MDSQRFDDFPPGASPTPPAIPNEPPDSASPDLFIWNPAECFGVCRSTSHTAHQHTPSPCDTDPARWAAWDASKIRWHPVERRQPLSNIFAWLDSPDRSKLSSPRNAPQPRPHTVLVPESPPSAGPSPLLPAPNTPIHTHHPLAPTVHVPTLVTRHRDPAAPAIPTAPSGRYTPFKTAEDIEPSLPLSSQASIPSSSTVNSSPAKRPRATDTPLPRETRTPVTSSVTDRPLSVSVPASVPASATKTPDGQFLVRQNLSMETPAFTLHPVQSTPKPSIRLPETPSPRSDLTHGVLHQNLACAALDFCPPSDELQTPARQAVPADPGSTAQTPCSDQNSGLDEPEIVQIIDIVDSPENEDDELTREPHLLNDSLRPNTPRENADTGVRYDLASQIIDVDAYQPLPGPHQKVRRRRTVPGYNPPSQPYHSKPAYQPPSGFRGFCMPGVTPQNSSTTAVRATRRSLPGRSLPKVPLFSPTPTPVRSSRVTLDVDQKPEPRRSLFVAPSANPPETSNVGKVALARVSDEQTRKARMRRNQSPARPTTNLFTTASGRNFNLPERALKRAQKLLDEPNTNTTNPQARSAGSALRGALEVLGKVEEHKKQSAAKTGPRRPKRSYSPGISRPDLLLRSTPQSSAPDESCLADTVGGAQKQVKLNEPETGASRNTLHQKGRARDTSKKPNQLVSMSGDTCDLTEKARAAHDAHDEMDHQTGTETPIGNILQSNKVCEQLCQTPEVNSGPISTAVETTVVRDAKKLLGDIGNEKLQSALKKIAGTPKTPTPLLHDTPPPQSPVEPGCLSTYGLSPNLQCSDPDIESLQAREEQKSNHDCDEEGDFMVDHEGIENQIYEETSEEHWAEDILVEQPENKNTKCQAGQRDAGVFERQGPQAAHIQALETAERALVRVSREKDQSALKNSSHVANSTSPDATAQRKERTVRPGEVKMIPLNALAMGKELLQKVDVEKTSSEVKPPRDFDTPKSGILRPREGHGFALENTDEVEENLTHERKCSGPKDILKNAVCAAERNEQATSQNSTCSIMEKTPGILDTRRAVFGMEDERDSRAAVNGKNQTFDGPAAYPKSQKLLCVDGAQKYVMIDKAQPQSTSLFTTGGGKPVSIKTSAIQDARKILWSPPTDQEHRTDDIQIDSHAFDEGDTRNPDLITELAHEQVDTRSLLAGKHEDATGTMGLQNGGTLFTTGNGKPVVFQDNVLEKVQKLLDEDEDTKTMHALRGRRDLTSVSKLDKSAQGPEVEAARNILNMCKRTMNESSKQSGHPSAIFSTGSGRPVSVSDSGLRTAQRLFKDESTVLGEGNVKDHISLGPRALSTGNGKIVSIGDSALSEGHHLLRAKRDREEDISVDIDDEQSRGPDSQPPSNQKPRGNTKNGTVSLFSTGSGKRVAVSKASLQRGKALVDPSPTKCDLNSKLPSQGRGRTPLLSGCKSRSVNDGGKYETPPPIMGSRCFENEPVSTVSDTRVDRSPMIQRTPVQRKLALRGRNGTPVCGSTSKRQSFTKPRRISKGVPTKSPTKEVKTSHAAIPISLFVAPVGEEIMRVQSGNTQMTRISLMALAARSGGRRPPLSGTRYAELETPCAGITGARIYRFPPNRIGCSDVSKFLNTLFPASPVGRITRALLEGDGFFGMREVVWVVSSVFGRDAKSEDQMPVSSVGSKAWISNAFSLGVWKHACLEASFPGQCFLTLTRVLADIARRICIEWNQSIAPPLLRMARKDALPGTSCVVLVCGIQTANMIDISDGYYILKARLDDGLEAKCRSKRIFVGLKLFISGSGHESSQDQGTDEISFTTFKLHSNGVRPAKWNAKLGPRSVPLTLRSLSAIPSGGVVPSCLVLVHRSFPARFLEKVKPNDELGTSSLVWRSGEGEEQAEDRFAKKLEEMAFGGRAKEEALVEEYGDFKSRGTHRDVIRVCEVLVSDLSGKYFAKVVCWRSDEVTERQMACEGSVVQLYQVDPGPGPTSGRSQDTLTIRNSVPIRKVNIAFDAKLFAPRSAVRINTLGSFGTGQTFDSVLLLVHIGELKARRSRRHLYFMDDPSGAMLAVLFEGEDAKFPPRALKKVGPRGTVVYAKDLSAPCIQRSLDVVACEATLFTSWKSEREAKKLDYVDEAVKLLHVRLDGDLESIFCERARFARELEDGANTVGSDERVRRRLNPRSEVLQLLDYFEAWNS